MGAKGLDTGLVRLTNSSSFFFLYAFKNNCKNTSQLLLQSQNPDGFPDPNTSCVILIIRLGLGLQSLCAFCTHFLKE